MSGSSAENASSMSRTSVSAASARASPTRWRMPPESCEGRSPPTRRARRGRARCGPSRRSALPTPWISRGYAALSSTVRWGRSAKCWKTIDTCLRRSARICLASAWARSVPPSSTCPDVGFHSPLSMRMSVDLPEPERPMTTKISPCFTSNDASITAAVPSGLTSSRLAPCSEAADRLDGAAPEDLADVADRERGRAVVGADGRGAGVRGRVGRHGCAESCHAVGVATFRSWTSVTPSGAPGCGRSTRGHGRRPRVRGRPPWGGASGRLPPQGPAHTGPHADPMSIGSRPPCLIRGSTSTQDPHDGGDSRTILDRTSLECCGRGQNRDCYPFVILRWSSVRVTRAPGRARRTNGGGERPDGPRPGRTASASVGWCRAGRGPVPRGREPQRSNRPAIDATRGAGTTGPQAPRTHRRTMSTTAQAPTSGATPGFDEIPGRYKVRDLSWPRRAATSSASPSTRCPASWRCAPSTGSRSRSRAHASPAPCT